MRIFRHATAPDAPSRTLHRLALALVGALATLCATARPLAAPADYRLVWADEFDVPGLPDPARWTHDTVRNKEGWYNEERQYYSAPRAQNAVIKDGRLHITLRKEERRGEPDWGGQQYSSARLITRGKAEWTYGFFEVRARVACGKGTWPAIWMLSTKGGWPDDGELDIMEYVGRNPHQVSSAVHTKPAHAANPSWGVARVPDACKRFHRYQMHWTPQGVTFGVDGFAHLHYPRMEGAAGAWPFDAPQFMILNVAVGGHLGGPVDDRIFPTAMEVDYVRVWQPPGKP